MTGEGDRREPSNRASGETASREAERSEASDRASGQLRRATNADAEPLVALHERALRDAGTDPGDVPEREDLRDVEGEYLAAGGEFLVVEDEGEIVAMGGHRPVDDATIELFRIAVAPERQRAGLGDRVVSALEARGRKAGFDRVRLETVVEQDAAAKFYPARGYEETSRGPSASGRYTLLTFEKPL